MAEEYLLQQKQTITQLQKLIKETPYVPVTRTNEIQPTFLIGFPRSGTTLLDTILRTHSNIDVLEELPMVAKMIASLQHVATVSGIEKIDESSAKIANLSYLKEFKKHTTVGEKSVIIDKLPLNILHLPIINQIFPNAKFILALRHPLDCVLSCWMQDFKLNPAMANMVELDRIVDFYDTHEHPQAQY